MKIPAVALALLLSASLASAQTVSIQKASGDVSVRHGVTEQWTSAWAGQVLRPDDTFRTGAKGSAVLIASPQNGGQKRITLPAEVILDVADIRDLTPEELMLKLTMEKVRGSSYQSQDDLQTPNAAVVHGANGAPAAALKENDPRAGAEEWNGAQVLYDNGFFSTCALKGMELFRLYPETSKSFDRRCLVAHALELARLRGEALSEYAAIEGLDGLTAGQRSTLSQSIARLKSSH